MLKKIKNLSCLSLLLFLTNCSLFQVVINQGNIVDDEMLEKLEVGMTESQVKYILGTPLISDTFFPNRWDYYTSVSQGEMVLAETKVILYFEDGKLIKWEGGLLEKDIESK
ncbi:MAG TPA: hypothetical protein DCG42_01025 [Maribacter sp.]|jgi:outer membrane protein assembly factor BamE|nr:hypothetical protein [Maribacter sp.]